nr:metalloregulator ArsR/SmtB family transcription factor [Cryptosporangium arvum]
MPLNPIGVPDADPVHVDDVDRSERGLTLAHRGFQRGQVTHVGRPRDDAPVERFDQPDRFGQVVGPSHRIPHRADLAAEIDRDDVRALLGEPDRVTAALPPCGTGDERDLAVELPHAASRSRLTGKSVLAYRSGMADVFKALADPTRRTILDELRERDDQTLFELCGRLTMKHGLSSSRQAISQHLDVLEEAGLVTTRRAGRYKYHRLDTSPLRAIVERWPLTDQE